MLLQPSAEEESKLVNEETKDVSDDTNSVKEILVAPRDADGRPIISASVTLSINELDNLSIITSRLGNRIFIVCPSTEVAAQILHLHNQQFEYCSSSQLEDDFDLPCDREHDNSNTKLIYLKEINEIDDEFSDSGSEHGGGTIVFPIEPTSMEVPHGKNSSIVTIFSMWSTMMGTSILTMPWAIGQAGFFLGIFLLIVVAVIMCYLAYRILMSSQELAVATNYPFPHMLDFSKVCSHYLGRAGKAFCLLSSIISLAGALIVYYVLLVNFLFNVGDFIRHSIYQDFPDTPSNLTNFGISSKEKCLVFPNSSYDGVAIAIYVENQMDSLYYYLWNPSRTVPVWLIILVFPLVCIRSPTFFTKFTALGTIAIAYILVLTFAKAGRWGINFDLSIKNSPYSIPLAKSTFPVLTGVGTLAFFIHNSIESIMRCNKNEKKNSRDLIIAFALVAITYMIVGIVFYISFPMSKRCLQDNLLNNLSASGIFGFVGRLALFFQILTVFPLLMYVLRVQVMYASFHSVYPGVFHVAIFHTLMLLICVLFAMFLPSIGTIIRFSGSFSALIYIFALPCIVYILRLLRDPVDVKTAAMTAHGHPSLKQKFCTPKFSVQNLTIRTFFLVLIHIFILLLGVANFVAQFVISKQI